MVGEGVLAIAKIANIAKIAKIENARATPVPG
jgi:hypothetical protein